MLERVDTMAHRCDILIIGGGATGLGTAVEAASRGLRTILIEQRDFASATSSRSTKLVHGGVRYLQQGNVGLVLEALRERGILRRNAPHLVHPLSFVVPSYDWWERPYYGTGLKFYDLLAGRRSFGPSRLLNVSRTLAEVPTVRRVGLRGSVRYFDGQFDDARLAITLACTAADLGAVVLNYSRAVSLLHSKGVACGAVVRDELSGGTVEIQAGVVINATGPFSDAIRKMDSEDARPIIAPSRGVHIVVDQSFLPGNSAVLVPRTSDGRVLFMIPWHGRTLIGTTDTPVDQADLEPRAAQSEIEFLLENAAKYLSVAPTIADIRAVFAGVRPLARPQAEPDEGGTAAVSREHVVLVAKSGLVTVAGGKWTTYRKMAEDTVRRAVAAASERGRIHNTAARTAGAAGTENLPLHGYLSNPTVADGDPLRIYGADAAEIRKLVQDDPTLGRPLLSGFPHIVAEVVWAVREEMAETVEDVLARRTRLLLLDARASMEAAPAVAELIAGVRKHDANWQREQVEHYYALARRYLP